MRLMARRVEMTAMRRMALAAVCVAIGATSGTSALALRMEVAAPAAQNGSDAGGANKKPERVSGGVMAGQVLTKVNPIYPPDAKAEKIEGAVVLQAIIGRDGVVENLQVVSGPEKLRACSLDAVRQWTYKPFLLNGEPVEVETTITVTYSLAK